MTNYLNPQPTRLETSTKSPISHVPLNVRFTVDELTDTHTQSASFPQGRGQDPTFESNESPIPSVQLAGPSPPITNPTFMRDPTPDQQNPNMGNMRQVYYAEILPDAYYLWKNFRNSSQREAACCIRAGYLRYLARAGRFPAWASGMMPPPGLVTTVDASLKIVSNHRIQASSSLNLVASFLEDEANAHRTNVDTYSEGILRQYAQYVPPPGSSLNYSYQTELELAGKLVERDNHELNKKLNLESDELKLTPESVLWTKIPNSLRPKSEIQTPISNALVTAENAQYSDVVQINTNRPPNGMNPFSSLTMAEQSRSTQNN